MFIILDANGCFRRVNAYMANALCARLLIYEFAITASLSLVAVSSITIVISLRLQQENVLSMYCYENGNYESVNLFICLQFIRHELEMMFLLIDKPVLCNTRLTMIVVVAGQKSI